MKRLVLVAVAVPVLLLGTVVGCKKPDETPVPDKSLKARVEGLPKVQVASAQVESAELSRTLDITGQLNADETSNVAALVPGVVMETPVDVGDVVKRGDALLRLDDRDARLRLTASQAQVMQIRAKLNLPMEDPKEGDKAVVNVDAIPEVRLALANQESAKVDLERNKKLYDEKAISQQQYDLARLKLDQAESNTAMARNGIAQAVASLAAAEAQVAISRKAVSDMTIRAPFNGAVVKRNVSMGEWATPAAPLLQMVKSESLRLVLDVPEAAVGTLQPGQDVEVTVQGRTMTEHGKVLRIAPAVDGNTRSLRVEAKVDNSAGRLRPGMFATARVVLNSKDLVLWVPKEAVVTLSGTSKVFLVSGDHVEERIVVMGDVRDGLVEVRGQLKVGDRVAIKNVDKLVDGAPVEG